MRKRKIIAVAAIAFFATGLAVFMLTRDPGPPVVVDGNFSAKDVREIKSAMRHELWREAFPNFSWGNVKMLPQGIRRALTFHVFVIQRVKADQSALCFLGSGAEDRELLALLETNATYPHEMHFNMLTMGEFYSLTNGLAGWSVVRTRTAGWAGWTSYSTLTNSNGH